MLVLFCLCFKYRVGPLGFTNLGVACEMACVVNVVRGGMQAESVGVL